MTEYQIQSNSRRCASTGRELQPGEKFRSVLFDENGQLVRKDYAEEAWQGPPEGAFSFWSGRIPLLESTFRPPIDDDLLLDCFCRLEGQVEQDRVNFRYVLALLLMRRKRFKFEEARMEGDQEILLLRCARSGDKYQVLNPRLTEEAMVSVQEEVFRILGWN